MPGTIALAKTCQNLQVALGSLLRVSAELEVPQLTVSEGPWQNCYGEAAPTGPTDYA